MIDATAVSVFANWPDLVIVITGNALVTGVIARAVADDQFRKAWDRNKGHIKDRLQEWFKERIDKVDAVVTEVAVHEDRMTAFETSLLKQGEAIQNAFMDHTERTTKALEKMTDTLTAIEDQAVQTAVLVGRIDERTKRMPGATPT